MPWLRSALPPGYELIWEGNTNICRKPGKRLAMVVPATLI